MKKKILLVLLFLHGIAILSGFGSTREEEIKRRGAEFETLQRERKGGERHVEELKAAWGYFDTLKMEEASGVFTAILASADSGESDRIQALYGLGLCYKFKIPLSDKKKARNYFLKLAEEYPRNTIAPWALLELGALEDNFSEEGRIEARKYYRRVLKEYPASLAIHETALRLADTYLGKELDPALIEEGLSLLETHIARYPHNPLVASMHHRLNYFYFACLQDYEKSLPHAVQLGILRVEDPTRGADDNWQTAMNFLRLNRVAEARPWFEKILKENPFSWQVLGAKEMIARIDRYLGAKPERNPEPAND